MKELYDLLKALEYDLHRTDHQMSPGVYDTYQAYKAATKPMVLEAVEYDDIKVGEVFLGWCNLMYMTFSKSANRIKDEQKGKCYRLPREEQ